MTCRLVPAVLVAAACSGCIPSAPPPAGVSTAGESSGTKSWNRFGDGSGTSGLDDGTVYYVGSRFVIWAAEGRGGGGGSTTIGQGNAAGDGHVSLNGGRSVTFKFDLPAGKPGTATVDGTTYDLANGRVILLKPVRDKLVVKQVDTDLKGAKVGEADLAAFGRSTPAIREFFESK